MRLVFGDARDALFLGIIVANSAIGITQEVRAKRALDRLSLLVAPHATVRRDGTTRPVGVEQLVLDDVVVLAAGDQLVADGTVLSATDLRLNESILTGESEPTSHGPGDNVHSGRRRLPIRPPRPRPVDQRRAHGRPDHLIASGLSLVMALEAGGSRRRSTLVGGMCVVMGGIYVAALIIPAIRTFFALTVPRPGMLGTALLSSMVSIAALWVSRFSLRVDPKRSSEPADIAAVSELAGVPEDTTLGRE